jgi:hypothetical protein
VHYPLQCCGSLDGQLDDTAVQGRHFRVTINIGFSFMTEIPSTQRNSMNRSGVWGWSS